MREKAKMQAVRLARQARHFHYYKNRARNDDDDDAPWKSLRYDEPSLLSEDLHAQGERRDDLGLTEDVKQATQLSLELHMLAEAQA